LDWEARVMDCVTNTWLEEAAQTKESIALGKNDARFARFMSCGMDYDARAVTLCYEQNPEIQNLRSS